MLKVYIYINIDICLASTVFYASIRATLINFNEVDGTDGNMTIINGI